MRHRTGEQGAIKSYFIGFILSLIFTLIPYYLVQSHKGIGNVLLLAILGLAVIQLIIQVIYFLHLGRGPKPHWELYFFISTIGIILVVVGASLIIIQNLRSNMSVIDQKTKLINDEAIYQVDGKLTGACQTTLANHQIVIKNDAVSPRQITANKCDTLTFVNEDRHIHAITFGTHPAHDSYAGESELNVRPGKSKTITLSEVGGFNYHDHQRPLIVGSFLVLNDDQGH
jgi:cytochrome o ubiquinol oxidase subunit IV